MQLRIVVAVLGLSGIGSEQYARLRRTIDFLGEDGVFDLQKKHSQRNVLNDFLARVFGKIFGAKLEYERTLFGNVLTQDFLVELEPREQALGVLVLQTKVPNLAQANSLDHLIEQLFACGGVLYGELQLGVHGNYAHIYRFGGHVY